MHCLCGGKKYKGIIDTNVLTLGHGATVIASAQDTKDQGSNPPGFLPLNRKANPTIF
jgi:hypothetical protein